MVTVLVAVAMLGYGLALYRRSGWPVETIPLALAACAIDILYLAGLLGVLRPGAWAIVAVGLVLCALSLRSVTWDPHALREVPPGIVAFVVLVAAVAWRFQGAAFGGWDEFSHWGLTSRVIVQTQALISSDGPILFKDYPPGSALFHYLLTLGRDFSESGMYVAHAVLAIAAVTALCTGSRWPAVLATVTFAYFGLFTLARGLQTLDVDHLVALFFGCGLGSYFLSKDSGRVVRLIPVAFALPLLKNVGLLLAIFMVCAVIADQLLSGRPSRRQLVVMLLLALAPFAASRTWSRHVKALGASPTFSLQITAGSVRDSFSADRSSPRNRATIAAFRSALVSAPVSAPRISTFADQVLEKLKLGTRSGPGLTALACTVILLLFAALIAAIQPDTSGVVRSLSSTFWLAACGVCYGSGLLVLYLFSFSDYEGTRLASFARYFGLLFLGAGLTVFAWALMASRSAGWRGVAGKLAVVGLVLGMVGIAPDDAGYFASRGPHKLTPARARIQKALQPALARAAEGDRIFMVWQGSTGMELYTGRYEVTPRTTNLSCWSLGAPRFEGDVWTCPLSPGEWAAMLENFDFVVLGRVDQGFWEDYGELFHGSRDTKVYKVEKSHAGATLHLSGVFQSSGDSRNESPNPHVRTRRSAARGRASEAPPARLLRATFLTMLCGNSWSSVPEDSAECRA
jgi:hypothetical protein